MSHGELEARTLAAERSQASAPPDVSRRLRLTAQAEADAWQQSAYAATRHDQAGTANAKALAGQLAAERLYLEAANAHYEEWATVTADTRETGAKAHAELDGRRLAAAAGSRDGLPVADRPVVRTNELSSRAAEAARRIAAERQARTECSVRIFREAQAQLEPTQEIWAQHETEIEM